MDIKQQISIVQHYINCVKGIEVDICINSGRDVFLLNRAYLIAVDYFKDKTIFQT